MKNKIVFVMALSYIVAGTAHGQAVYSEANSSRFVDLYPKNRITASAGTYADVQSGGSYPGALERPAYITVPPFYDRSEYALASAMAEFRSWSNFGNIAEGLHLNTHRPSGRRCFSISHDPAATLSSIAPEDAICDVGSGTTGTPTNTSLFLCKEHESFPCVDSVNTEAWAGSDIGAWINAAYASLPTPATGGRIAGKILVFPKPDGSCYAQSTAILLSTNGKPASIDFRGACLDWSANISGTAITLDWGQGPGEGWKIENLKQIGPCATNACTGVFAVAISLGPTNGLVGGEFHNIQIGGRVGDQKGFLTAWANGANGYIYQCYNCLIANNNVGVNYPVGNEGVKFIGGSISGNAIAVQTAGNGSKVELIGVQLDDNGTAIVRESTSTFTLELIGCHFENAGLGALNVLNDRASGITRFIGGDIQNDVTSGTLTQFIVENGVFLEILGMSDFTAGETVTQAVTVGSSVIAKIDLINTGRTIPDFNPATLGAVYDVNAATTRTLELAGGWNFFLGPTGGSNPSTLQFSENAFVGSGTAGRDVCDGSANHALYCSYNNGTMLPIGQIVSGSLVTTAATSDNVTLIGMTPSGHCYLTPTNATAAANVATTYVSAKTTNQITVTHTASARMNYDIACTPQ